MIWVYVIESGPAAVQDGLDALDVPNHRESDDGVLSSPRHFTLQLEPKRRGAACRAFKEQIPVVVGEKMGRPVSELPQLGLVVLA